MRQIAKKPERCDPWFAEIMARKPGKVAAVATANEVMENLSALEPRHTVLGSEHMLFDMQNGTWFVETIHCPAVHVSTHEKEGQRQSDPRKQAGHKPPSDNHRSHQICLDK
jgi:hypothetical protein